MNFLNYSEVRTVHLELTTKCNAGCPMCLRTKILEERPKEFPSGELSLSDIKRIFPKKFLKQLNLLYMCGNLGDAASAKDVVPICNYLRASNSELKLRLYSNAGLKSETWWKNLAKTVERVHFSIDGLKDTNHLYRKNVDFDKAIGNMKAYISAGGEAIWDFLVFSHNEHQIELVKKMAEDLGVHTLRIKSSPRFTENPTKPTKLKPTKIEKFQNSFSLEDKGWGDSSVYKRGVSCQAQKEKSIYVSAHGELFPCCWLGAIRYHPGTGDNRKMHALASAYGEEFPKNLALTKGKGIEGVLNGPLYKEALVRSWGSEIQFEACSRFCGVTDNAYKSQLIEEIEKPDDQTDI